MTTKFWLILALLLSTPVLTACGPLLGAGAVVAADEASEDNGDDGLF